MNDGTLKSFESITGGANVDMSVDPPVLRPPDEHSVAEVLKKSTSEGVSVFIKGSGTMPSPAYNDGIVLDMKGFSGKAVIDRDDFMSVIPAGVTVETLASEAGNNGVRLPLDSLYGGKATLGGAFMSGFAGLSAYAARPLRDAVTGTRCVAADGAVVTGGGKTAKNVTGYELTRFFAGTMGLFGVVTELIVKLEPLPQSRMAVSGVFKKIPDFQRLLLSIDTAIRCAAQTEVFTGPEKAEVAVIVEGLESVVLSSADIAGNLMSDAGAYDIATAPAGEYILRRRGENVLPMETDFHTVTLPPASTGILVGFIVNLDHHIPVVAHPRAGKLHFVSGDTSMVGMVREKSLALGGKPPVSRSDIVRHGVAGLFSSSELDMVRALKRELDPKNILNPHILIP